MKHILYLLLATFALTLPVSAARYHYKLDSGPPKENFPPKPFPATAFSFSWQSDHLLASPQCPATDADISKLPGFSGPMLTGTDAAAYTFVDIVLVCSLQPELLPLQIRVDWNVATPRGLCVSQPPFTLPFFALFLYNQIGPGTLNISGADILFSGAPEEEASCAFLIDYDNETVTITDTELPLPTYLWCETCQVRLTLNPEPIYELIPTLEAVVELDDLSGRPVGSAQRVSLAPGKLASVDFPPLPGVGAQDVVPVLRFVGARSALPAIQVTAESFDSRTGAPNGPLVTFSANLPPSILAPQSLGSGETLRLIARATSRHHCTATLSFSDPQGNPIGPTAFVNLSSGKAQTLDLSLDSLPAVQLPVGQRLEILPAVQPTRSLAGGGAPVRSVCSVTAEVFNSATGVTATYQNAFLQLGAIKAPEHRNQVDEREQPETDE